MWYAKSDNLLANNREFSMAKQVVKEALQAICDNNAERLRELSTADFMLVMDNGDVINGLDDYIEWLDELHQRHNHFNREVVETVAEEDENGVTVAVYTNNVVTNANGEEVEFNDFTQFHVNKDGKIDMARQGPGIYQHIVKG
jgi:ketosteroid isomerase-like protein